MTLMPRRPRTVASQLAFIVSVSVYWLPRNVNGKSPVATADSASLKAPKSASAPKTRMPVCRL